MWLVVWGAYVVGFALGVWVGMDTMVDFLEEHRMIRRG